jgi:hypothetical protein
MGEIVPPLAVCALLMPLEAALLPMLGHSAARVDLPLCAVVLLAVGGATTLWGAVGAFAVGFLADLLMPVHPGLFTLSGLLLFVVLRLVPVGRDVRGPLSFAVLVAFGCALDQLLVFGLLWVVGRPTPEAPVWPATQAVLLSTLFAPVFYWLCEQVSRVMTREDPSLLR